MIWQLVKRDPAWRNALYCAAASAVGCPILSREFISLFSALVVMCLFKSQPEQRATLFQAGLPIRVRELFLARILALLALVWLPASSGAAMLLLVGKRAEDAASLVELGAVFSALVLASQSSRVREIAGSRWTPGIAAAIVVAAAWPTSLFAPRALVAACAVLCPLLFWNIWRQLPIAFEVLPGKLTPQVVSSGDSGAPPAIVWWPILRSLFQPRTLLLLPMIVFMPLGGQWLYVLVFSVIPIVAVVEHMPWALSLPVRRTALLAAALLPWVTLLLLGVLLGIRFGTRPSIRLEWSASNRIADIRPPLEFWRAGQAPIIESPWGESWRPATVRLRGVAIYNPYSFGPANSARFFEWQFRRATEGVYGVAIDYADFKRHRPRVRPLTHQARMAILNLAACASGVMLLANLVFAAMHWRFRRVFDWQNAAGCLLMVLMVGVLLIDWAPGNNWAGPIGPSLVNALLLRVSAVLPAGLAAVALAAVLPAALLWWTAARLFRGVELPRPTAAVR